MPRISPEELQALVDLEEPDELEVKIKEELEGGRPLSFDDLAEELEANEDEMEDAVRHLLQRQEIGETADWRFYLAENQL